MLLRVRAWAKSFVDTIFIREDIQAICFIAIFFARWNIPALAGEFDAKNPRSGFLFFFQKRILYLVVVNPISAVILAGQAFPLKSELS